MVCRPSGRDFLRLNPYFLGTFGKIFFEAGEKTSSSHIATLSFNFNNKTS